MAFGNVNQTLQILPVWFVVQGADWLITFTEPEAQVARWLEELQAFNFNIEHRAKAHHANADASLVPAMCSRRVPLLQEERGERGRAAGRGVGWVH